MAQQWHRGKKAEKGQLEYSWSAITEGNYKLRIENAAYNNGLLTARAAWGKKG
jgi:hypothetical protein